MSNGPSSSSMNTISSTSIEESLNQIEETKAEKKSGYRTEQLKKFIRYYSGEFDTWWNREFITDKQLMLSGVSEYLCAYCSYKFDTWYNKDLFNVQAYPFLSEYCRYTFDKWFDKKTLKKYFLNCTRINKRDGLSFLDYFSYQDRFKDIYISEFLEQHKCIEYLYQNYNSEKTFWLDKNIINFTSQDICENLVQYCGKDIELWFDKDNFSYNPETCFYFCHEFDHADHRRKLIKTFKLWWNPNKFDFRKIIKMNEALRSWENMYSEYRKEWEKHIICEKLRE